MEAAWKVDLAVDNDIWFNDNDTDLNSQVEKWLQGPGVNANRTWHTRKQQSVSNGIRQRISLAHGSFDNDKKVLMRAIENITGNKANVRGWDLSCY